MSWLGDKATRFCWEHTHSHNLHLYQDLDATIKVIKSLRHLLCGKEWQDSKSRGVLEEHVRVSWVLCQIIIQYFHGREGRQLWNRAHNHPLGKSKSISQGDEPHESCGIDFSTPWHAQSHVWWEVVLYIIDILRLQCCGNQSSGVLALSWKSLRSLLLQADHVKIWLNVPHETFMSCLVEMLLMMSPVKYNDFVHEEDIMYWTKVASWGISKVCQNQQGQTLLSPRETAKQLLRECHPGISQVGRFILWLAAWFSHGCSPSSHWQTGMLAAIHIPQGWCSIPEYDKEIIAICMLCRALEEPEATRMSTSFYPTI